MATGGLFRKIKTSLDPKLALPDFGQLRDRLARKLGRKLGAGIGGKLDRAREKYGDGPVKGGNTAKALSWVRSHVGHPYQFGTIWDCSGLVGAAHSIALGQGPHRRYATPAFHGSRAAGFTRGKKSSFMVAVNPAPGKFGHMVGQINGVPIESAGGVGVRVGASARKLSNPMFSWRGGLAGGGFVPASIRRRGDLPFDLPDRRGQRYSPRLEKLLPKLYNNGGTLEKGLNLTYNGTRKPEAVLTNPQWDLTRRAVDRATNTTQAPGLVINGNIQGYTAEEVAQKIERLRRQREALAPTFI